MTEPQTPEAAPAYDPLVHTVADGDLMVLATFACACGQLKRQLDPVSVVLPQLADWADKHAGSGHRPVDAAAALEEREARRQAGFRAAGRQDEYEPKQRADVDLEAVSVDWRDEQVVEAITAPQGA